MNKDKWIDWCKWAGRESDIDYFANKEKILTAVKARPMVLARKIPGQLTQIIVRGGPGGSVSGGFTSCKDRACQYAMMAAEIKTHDPFQRVSPFPKRTGQIPIWRVGEVIALGVAGDGKV